MGVLDYFRPKAEAKEVVHIKPCIKSLPSLTYESFKGEVPVKEIQYPRGVGVRHSNNLEILEKWYKDDALVTGIIDKFVDFTVGPGFFVKSKDPRAQELITQYMDDRNFDCVLREFVRNGLIYGDGYIEISDTDLKVHNSKYMYVNIDNKGNVEGYTQWFGGRSKIIPFTPKEIAHFSHRKIGDSPYGDGVIQPLTYDLSRKAKLLWDMLYLMHRKANTPIVAKLGTKEEPVPDGDVTSFGKDMESLTNKNEWATNHLVELSILDFGKLGEKFTEPLRIINNDIMAGAQVPEVLLSSGQLNEGIAIAQMDGFKMRIQSIQAEVESVLETNLFKPYLEAQGLFNVKVEFEWGQPSDEDKREEVNMLMSILDSRYNVFGDLRTSAETRIAELLGFEEIETPDEEKEREATEPQPKVPPAEITPPIPVNKSKPKEVK